MEAKKEEEPDLKSDLVINEKYQIQYKLGKGGYGKVYLVQNIKDDKKYYAMKVLLLKRSTSNDIELFKKEITILKELHKLNNSYILKVYEEGKFTTEDQMERSYFIMDYAEKGDLLHYVKTNYGLYEEKEKEKFCKIIFKKILEGIQFCHDNDYCHLDIKLENILLDDKFNPIINDFGLSLKMWKNGKLRRFRGTIGTKKYMCPQMFDKEHCSYNGLDADIFALGVLLFQLVTGEDGFINANDNTYNDIKSENYTNYWMRFFNYERFSQAFKDLYLSMVAFNPKKRPNINYILTKDPWLNEINTLIEKNPEEYQKLEEKYIEFMEEVENKIKEKNQPKIEIPKKNEGGEKKKSTRGFTSVKEGKKYFIDLIPKKIKDKRNYKYYINLIGNLNANDFMNSLINEIKKNYDNECYINTDNEKLKFQITFINEDNDDDEEEDEEDKTTEEKNKKEKNKEDNVEIEDVKNNIRDCIMKVKLYDCGNDEYLLCFEKNQGDLEEFYEHFLKIKKIITEGNIFN